MLATPSALSGDLPLAFVKPVRIRFFDLLLLAGMTILLVAIAIGIVFLTGTEKWVVDAAARPGQNPGSFIVVLAVAFGLVLFAALVSVARFGGTAPWLLGFRHASIEWWLGGPLGMVGLSILLAMVVIPGLQHSFGIDPKISTSDIVKQLLPDRIIAIFAVLVIGGLAPLVEEFVFRGVLFGWLIGRFPGWVAVLGSSIAFGFAHGEPLHGVMAAVLGLWLGIVRLRSGSIWPCILAHMANNTVFVLALHLFPTL